jgi:hypothetical protein
MNQCDEERGRGYVTQYKRLSFEGGFSAAFEAKGGIGVLQAGVSGGAGRSVTFMVNESIGTDTFSYVQTVYNGYSYSPEKWNAWKGEHIKDIKQLIITMKGHQAEMKATSVDVIFDRYLELLYRDKNTEANKENFGEENGDSIEAIITAKRMKMIEELDTPSVELKDLEYSNLDQYLEGAKKDTSGVWVRRKSFDKYCIDSVDKFCDLSM